MTSIQDLPNEVLLDIFRLGCDDPEFKPDPFYEFDRPSHARKRKQLIAVARLVCFRWHQLVDLQCLPYGCRFWFAQLSLSLRKTSFDTHLLAPNILLRRLIQFRQSLSTSQGCDLVIDLDAGGITKIDLDEVFDHLKQIPDSYQDASPEDQLTIRLFLSGAFEVLQQRNQILAIQIRIEQIPLHNHMVELLAGLEPAHRLKLIQISALRDASRYGPVPLHYPSLRGLALLISVPGFGALNPRALHAQERWGVSLSHLAHLDTLCIPLLWLQDLDYNFSVSHLFLWVEPHTEVEPPPATAFASPLCANLRELTINWPIVDTSITDVDTMQREFPIISFTRLTRLEVQQMPDSRAYWFLTQIECPQLTEARLQIESWLRFLTRSKWAPTNQNRFPQLAVLQITFSDPFSLDSLYLLDVFKHSPVERLSLWNIGPFGENVSRGSTRTVMDILSHFEPDSVKIDASCLKSILAVLRGLSCLLLQEATLSIRLNERENPSNSAADDPSPFGIKKQIPQILDLPLLSTLVVRRMMRIQPLEIFQQINADNLKHLSLNLNPRSDMTDDAVLRVFQKSVGIKKGARGAGLPPYFPSLHSMKLCVSLWEEQDSKDAFLPKLWEMTPNLKRLELIHADSSPSILPGVCKLIFASLNPIHISSSEEGVPTLSTLPSLSRLDVTCPVITIPGLFTATERDVEAVAERGVEAARIETVNSLVSRHGMGAIPLELTEFLYDPHDKVLKFCAQNKVDA